MQIQYFSDHVLGVSLPSVELQIDRELAAVNKVLSDNFSEPEQPCDPADSPGGPWPQIDSVQRQICDQVHL